MKNIKFLSALFLLISITVTLFSACKSKKTVNNETTTEQSTRITTTKVHATDYTYHPITVQTQESVTEYIFTVPPVPTEENKTVKKTDKSNQTTNKKETAPDKKTSDEKIEEISKELALITKTSPVIKGNSATVIIQGTPGPLFQPLP